MSEAHTLITPADRSRFSLHPEDEMTERRSHAKQVGYFDDALTSLLPEFFIARNMAVYWIPGQREYPYVGPDLFVSRYHPKEENPTCYLTYEDGPIAFVIEVASEKTRANELKKRDETYGTILRIPEYLYVDQERHVLELWRLVEGAYERVSSDEQGRFWSPGLAIAFAWQDDGRMVRVLTTDGTMVPTAQEERALRRAAETQVAQEARRAERETQRARREARRRAAAEEQARALAAEIERLRRVLEERGDAR
jgi:hypothetical protein